jgi:hypothetical protein
MTWDEEELKWESFTGNKLKFHVFYRIESEEVDEEIKDLVRLLCKQKKCFFVWQITDNDGNDCREIDGSSKDSSVQNVMDYIRNNNCGDRI